MRKAIISGVVFFCVCGISSATNYYVSPTGSDNGGGTIDHPYATIGKGVSMVSAGDTIYLRGGQHDCVNVIKIEDVDGMPANPITMCAYGNEVPVIDFAAESTGIRGIELKSDYWVFKDFIIQNAGDNGLYITGTHNHIERIITRWNGDSGIQLHSGAAYNLVLNCDSYENYDVNGNGENADGFATKFALGPGNVLRGCRSWSNSDDGYDCWNYFDSQQVVFDRCWSFQNGINIWGDTAFAGDGNGFKLGAGSGNHWLINCVAFENPHHGIDINGNTEGVTVYNCTCIANGGTNYYFDEHNSANVLRNNISYLASVNIYEEIDDQYNTWNGLAVDSEDFASLDATGLNGPREADGSLPKISFARLVPSSSAIDVGIDVGLEYTEAAPDLGAFEFIMGDCVIDGEVDLADLECLAARWMDTHCGTCGGADFDLDQDVNLEDFRKTAENWLY